MGEALDNHTQAIWSEARQAYGGHDFVLQEGGDYGRVLLVDASTDCSAGAYVVKIARDFEEARQLLGFETRLLDFLSRADADPPVEIPQLYDYYPDPGYAVLSYVPGVNALAKTYRAFSAEERNMMGAALGEFVHWLSGTVSYKDWIALRPHRLPDRTEWFEALTEKILSTKDTYPTFEKYGKVVLEDYAYYDAQDWLWSEHIGHDDLRPQNLTLLQKDGRWQLHGVIDFGITQPSSLSREMRHMAAIDRRIARQAIKWCSHQDRSLLIEGDMLTTEDAAAAWAHLQVVTNTMVRLDDGWPLGSALLKLRNLYRFANWQEFAAMQ